MLFFTLIITPQHMILTFFKLWIIILLMLGQEQRISPRQSLFRVPRKSRNICEVNTTAGILLYLYVCIYEYVILSPLSNEQPFRG